MMKVYKSIFEHSKKEYRTLNADPGSIFDIQNSVFDIPVSTFLPEGSVLLNIEYKA
jgi:hypothetical protein